MLVELSRVTGKCGERLHTKEISVERTRPGHNWQNAAYGALLNIFSRPA